MSVAAFVAELHTLAAMCKIGDKLEDILRKRIVCGINESTILKRLLADPKLTFKLALELACGLETAARKVKELKAPMGKGVVRQRKKC